MYKRDLPAHFLGDVFCIWACSETLLYGKVSAIVKNLILLPSFSEIQYSTCWHSVLLNLCSCMFCAPVVISCCCCSVLKEGREIERVDLKESFPLKRTSADEFVKFLFKRDPNYMICLE